jgi:glutamine amidotransferase
MIAIIDYGLGNVKAFANVYYRLNIPTVIVKQPNDLKAAKKIILPGVGSFDHAMQMLDKSGLRQVLDEFVLHRHVPVLGICVGMQMLAHSSEEGVLPGLGWINGEVRKFSKELGVRSEELGIRSQKLGVRSEELGVKNLSLPHMGWNDVMPTKKSKLFEGYEQNARFYFLHSYYFNVQNNDDVIAVTDYGASFTSAINFRNVYGVQFHPEKSHQYGSQLLKNFAEM